jgi:hypothetical protein
LIGVNPAEVGLVGHTPPRRHQRKKKIDWRFCSRIMGKSHDPRDQFSR